MQHKRLAHHLLLRLFSSRELDNKKLILGQIDSALGRNRPPSLEYLYVEADMRAIVQSTFGGKLLGLYDSNSAANPYGHSALRYSFEGPHGRENWVMNVCGSGKLVNFYSPEEYIFGHSAEQGGIYKRAFRGFRIEKLPESGIMAMHQYFLQLHERNNSGSAKYSMFLGNTLPFLGNSKQDSCEQGNCSYWTSKGLILARALFNPTMWPKVLFVKLYIEMVRAARGRRGHNPHLHPSNCNIIAYTKAGYYFHQSAHEPSVGSWVSPSWFMSWQSRLFRPLGRFANLVVETPAEPPSIQESFPKAWAAEVWLNKPFRPFLDKEHQS